MKKQTSMTELLMPLAMACREQSGCEGCPLCFGGGVCRLRLMPPRSAAASLLAKDKPYVMWVRFDDREAVLNVVDFFKGLPEFAPGDTMRFWVRLYVVSDGTFFPVKRLLGDAALEIISDKYPSEHLCLRPES